MRSVSIPLLVLLPKLLTLGCSQVTQGNNLDELDGPRTAVVGVQVPITFKTQHEHLLAYDNYGEGWFCDQRTVEFPTESMESASCDGNDCRLERNGNTLFVTASTAQTVTVKAIAVDSNGGRRLLTHDVTFGDVTALDVVRNPTAHPAGAATATLRGTWQTWRVTPRIGDEAAFAATDLRVLGEGAVSAARSAVAPNEFVITSALAGLGHVQMSVGSFTRTFQMNVLDPDRIESASLVATPVGDSVSVVEVLDVEQPTALFDAVESPLRLRLCDSAAPTRGVAVRVVDDAGNVGLAALADTLVAPRPPLSIDGNLVTPLEAGPGAILGKVGHVAFRVPFVVEPECHEQIVVGAPDAGVDADGGADVDADAASADG